MALVMLFPVPVANVSHVVATLSPSNQLYFAHYYIWYDSSSWSELNNEGQSRMVDWPLSGDYHGNSGMGIGYNSQDPTVIKSQITLAKDAGLNGWIVSWWNDPQRNTALTQLVPIAQEQEFKIVIAIASLGQGFPGSRPTRTTSEMMDAYTYLNDTYLSNPAFLPLKAKSLVAIWEGSDTWTQNGLISNVTSVVNTFRSTILTLGDVKDAASYANESSIWEGDAPYFSTIDVVNRSGWAQASLDPLAQTVKSYGHVWIAPIIPGYDSSRLDRPSGGTAVQRRNGQTLATDWAIAKQTQPDIYGLISWNEWWENSYVEPSLNYGNTYVNNLATLTGGPGVSSTSSLPSLTLILPIVLVLGIVSGTTIYAVERRRKRARQQREAPESAKSNH